MLTFLPLEEIDAMDKWEGSQLNRAKEILAFELTKLVHGEEEAKRAEAAAKALFAGGADNSNMPTTALSAEDFTDGAITVIELLVKAGLCSTRSDARRTIEQGGVFVGDDKVTEVKAAVEEARFAGDGLIIRKGKKNFHKFTK
ncbi:MAG: tyrosine--tRNA ligase, partial [Clostridia bacterium]|nr:tyrosine--tRNA ligase [Clostridia bacterium]